MIEHLFTQLIRSFGIFFRTIRAFFARKLVGLTARLRRLFNFSRNATKAAMSSLQGAASLAQKPTKREDYIETSRLFISKSLLLGLVLGAAVLALMVHFMIWPFLLSRFFTARFYMEDRRLETWTGQVIVYSDKQKTIPQRAGRLTNGSLEGEGKEYDEAGLLCYEGNFRSNQPDGTGTAYENGVLVYTGDFSAGRRSGWGRLYRDGTLFYEGQFQEDVPSGTGTTYNPNGQTSYHGEFANGMYEGQGTSYDRQGNRIYTGSFSRGKYNGQGSLYLSRSQWIRATFAEGQPEGTVQWMKNGVLYYEGKWSNQHPEGFGRIYSQAGKVLYEGQLAGGTVDGQWLLELSLDDFRAALGESKLQQQADPNGGFTITSPTLGLSARCRFRQEDMEAAVDMVTLFCPQNDGKDWVDLLPSRVMGQEVQSEDILYTAIQGVPLASGTYRARQAVSEDGACRWTLLLDSSGTPILYQCAKTVGEARPPEVVEEDPGESRMDALLAALDMMGDAGTASSNSGASSNPYFGSGKLDDVLPACSNGGAGTRLVDAMLLYWENGERRTAAEANLARTEQLLKETAALGGDIAELEKDRSALEAIIEACAGEMQKAMFSAQETADVDLTQYDPADAPVMFDPSQLDVEDMALMTAAYIQATGGAVDAGQLALELKTALVDLNTAYSDVRQALQSYEDAGDAARKAAMAYSMETGSKEAWFAAQSAREDARAALVVSIAGFSRQANSLNGKSGGWIARNCGWHRDAFTELFQKDTENTGSEIEQSRPLEDRLEEILQGVQGQKEGT